MRKEQLEILEEVYFDARKCAALIGLSYHRLRSGKGILRQKSGRGFRYYDEKKASVCDETVKSRCQSLGIPPNWENVSIAPLEKNHIQAIGWDSLKRKQYIYHSKWREYRELLNSYRMILFGKTLSDIRRKIHAHMRGKKLDKTRVLAGIVLLLDSTYIRIGNDVYFEERRSVGLTTMRKKNVSIEGNMIRFQYKGKSGKKATVEVHDFGLAYFLSELMKLKGAAVFTYEHADGSIRKITSSDVNRYLKEISGRNLSAKDFRTWGGTLTAFSRLKTEVCEKEEKPKKAVIKALDEAAETLGNTRSVVRNTYVHPDLIRVSEEGKFSEYYERGKNLSPRDVLSLEETQLLKFLEILFEKEFDLLKL